MVGVLPLFIQLSLLLFSIGLALFLFHISNPSFLITTVIFGIGVLYFAITTSISVFVTSSPFHSPLSRTLGAAYRYVHTCFCPDIKWFLSPDMDTTPASALGRLHRGTQIFLQKLRPYLEKDFVDPIGATTMDEVQIVTAASALQRIHDNAPNSQHSERVQSSVWQIAGSPTLRIPPLFGPPPWVFDTRNDQGYHMSLPLDKVAALMAISSRPWPQNRPRNRAIASNSFIRPRSISESPWDRLVYGVFHVVRESDPKHSDTVEAKPDDLISMLQRNELGGEETIWLLNTLSDLRSHRLLLKEDPSFIEVCLGILSCQGRKWSYEPPADIVLLEAVVTYAAISCASNRAYRRKILNNSRQYPWLLLNLRNTELVRKMVEGVRDSHRRQLISILFLVLSLMWGRSEHFAAQHFAIITANSDFNLYTSALTAIARAIGDVGLSTIGRMLVAPPGQSLTSIIKDSIERTDCYVQEELLRNYDRLLGASRDPDPNILAILLLLSKQLPSSVVDLLHDLDLTLENPWLKRVARVIARLDIPDGPNRDMRSFGDHKVHNMIAALSLRRYAEANPTQYTESLLLASFLGSRELAVSALALEYYMQTILSSSDPSAPPRYFGRAVRAVFNLKLPGHQLKMGWKILDMFVKGFESLSDEWRRTFAEAFFTLSRQPLKKLRDDREISTAESELEKILTWEYFHEDEREFERTGPRYSGLDWMMKAWSLHLSQQSGTTIDDSTRGEARPQVSGGPMINEGFVLCALLKLLGAALDAALYNLVAQIIPNIRQFVQPFEHPDHSEYRSRIEELILIEQ